MVRRRPPRPAQITIDPVELAARYRDGASLDDLGILCGCSGNRIRRALAAQGVEIRPRGYFQGKSNRFIRRWPTA
jgi:hypothetical protein